MTSTLTHAVAPPSFLLQWEVLQAGGPHAHAGKTLARLDRRLAASHGDPHLHALCSQWEEGPVCLGHEGRQRHSERPSQGVSELEGCRSGLSSVARKHTGVSVYTR